MNKKLDKEYQFFEKNRKNLIKQYPDKFVIVKNQKIAGVYNTEESAYQHAIKSHKLGTFLIQQCIKEKEEKIAVFNSRVIFT